MTKRFSYIDLPLLLSMPVQRTFFWANSSFGYIQRRCLIPFPCSSCDSLLLSTIIGISNRQPLKSEVDLNESLRYSPNRQSFEQPRETFHQWAAPYHGRAGIRYWLGECTRMDPNYRHVGNFDLPESQNLPSINYIMTQIGQTIDPTARKMLSGLSFGTCHPSGSLAIVNKA